MNRPDILISESLPNRLAQIKVAEAALDIMGIESLSMPNSSVPLIVVPYTGQTRLEGGIFTKSEYSVWHIAINCRDYPRFLRQFLTFIHELIHAVQFASGDLALDSNCNFLIWKGQRYDLMTTSYMSRPWEKEAYLKQEKICRAVRAKLGF